MRDTNLWIKNVCSRIPYVSWKIKKKEHKRQTSKCRTQYVRIAWSVRRASNTVSKTLPILLTMILSDIFSCIMPMFRCSKWHTSLKEDWSQFKCSSNIRSRYFFSMNSFWGSRNAIFATLAKLMPISQVVLEIVWADRQYCSRVSTFSLNQKSFLLIFILVPFFNVTC